MSRSKPQSSDQPGAKYVTCPACRGKSLYSPSNPFRPFCSERCKQIDLGAWASEEFRVPTEAPLEDQESSERHPHLPQLPPSSWDK
ncbi:DNA gyrase inhibitor YacG [Paracidovorax valerianellae]|uniref:DNA gyrase inhibitor YacG n=1 Tax=Paracidovorax valerianellae TaxID=187868 RepID=UPI000B828183|nr:DNA gyrase inhibitor YacG [Paracidovorax valerianellae]MDA8444722.1 DNA gyrase inhibitor YacG [Paracidovorax valerianellae]